MSEKINRDIVIVGTGIQGLSCAYLLAKEGLAVTLLSPPTPAEGALPDEEFYEGVTLGACLHYPTCISSSLLRKCDIKTDRDMEYIIPIHADDEDEAAISLPMGPGDAAEYFGESQDHYLEFWKSLGRVAMLLAGVMQSTPRDQGKTWQDLYHVYAAANRMSVQEEGIQKAFSDLFSLSVVDYVDRYLTSKDYKEMVVSEVSFIVNSNPLAPGSAAGLLDLTWQFLGPKTSRLGIENLRQALKAKCAEAGVIDKTIFKANSITIENGYARAVVTQDGQTYKAARIIADMPACQTFLDLMEDGLLSSEWRTRLLRESQSSPFVRIKLSLNDYPQSIKDDAKLLHTGYRLLGLSPESLAQSYSDALAGRMSKDMLVQIALCDVRDGVPDGLSLSVLGAYCHGELERSQENRVNLARAIMAKLCGHYDGLETSIKGFAVFMGAEIPRIFGVQPRHLSKGGPGFSAILSQTMFWKQLQNEHGFQNLYLVGQGAEAPVSYFNVNDPERIVSQVLSDLAI